MRTYLPIIMAITVSLAISIWWGIYKYRDCLKVGHTKTYCILDIGE